MATKPFRLSVALVLILALAGCTTVREIPVAAVLETYPKELESVQGLPVEGWVRSDGEVFPIPVSVWKRGNSLVFGDEPVFATLRISAVRGVLMKRFDAGKSALKTGEVIGKGVLLVVFVAVLLAVAIGAALA